MREYIFYVYVLQSASRRALYIGMTNNLRHRAFQHKTHQSEGFTDEYNAIRLVYWEKFGSVGKAIAREKQLKRWRREKKNWLVETINIFGVPFTFLPHEGTGDGPPPPPPSPKTRIEALPDRKGYEIAWPNVIRIDHQYRPQLTLDLPN